MSQLTFPTSGTNLAFGDFETSPIVVTETDTGNVVYRFTDYFPSSGYIGTFKTFVSTGTTGAETAVMRWGGFKAQVSGATGTGGTLNLQFDYDLSTTAPNTYITSLGQLLIEDVHTDSYQISAVETVTDSAGNLVGTLTWNSIGGVSMTLPANTYYNELHLHIDVTESVQAGQTGTIGFSSIQQSYTDATISVGSISGIAFLDADADGSLEGSETGAAGVSVELINTATNAVVETTTTDANGAYTFANLFAGSYQVAFVTPSGDVFSPIGTSASLPNSVVDSSGQTGTIVLAAGQNVANEDAGIYLPAGFTAHVYTDANANNTQNSGETNLGGVTVKLEDGTGAVVNTGTTDASGNVSFTGLKPGSYQVVVTTPSGDVVTQQTNVGTVNTLPSGGTANAIEGVYLPASFTTHVYTDANANNTQDSGETNLGGVTVALEDGTGTVVNTGTTDANGNVSFTGLRPGSYQVVVTTPSGDVVTQQTNVGTVNTLASGGTANAIEGVYAPPGTISVIKLPNKVVVGTCDQVSYTYKVTNTGSTPLTNVQISDNIGTAANPNTITPAAITQCGYNIGDLNHNSVLDAGETWQFTNTINQAGALTGGKSSLCQTISGCNLDDGSTAWLNGSFTPTSCRDGASYTFQNITCTISGPGCPTTTVKVPNACVTFSSQCTRPTTTFDPTQNCWVTTLPAGSNPGNVFLSGLPFEVPSGCNLSGATATWTIGQSSNNCGAGNVSWQTGCSGYSSFDSGCLSDFNQIGVKVCDNSASYGNWGCGDWSIGSWAYANGFGCAGTPGTQYSGWSWSGGTCNSGTGSGSICQGQLGDSSEADTVTVTASTLGKGFSLGDAANYGIIAFNPGSFRASSNDPIFGNVGIGGSWCATPTVSLNCDKITGKLVTTGNTPCSTGGTVTGGVTGHSATLAADIAALDSLSCTLGKETGKSVALTSGMTLNATSGVLDSSGNYVFTVTQWSNNITIAGDGTHNVVLNVSSCVTPILENVTLTGGLTANQVLFNDTYCDTINGIAGTTFNATMLAPNAVFAVNGVTVNGHLYGGADCQTFSLSCGATLNAPANTTTTTPAAGTVTATDSKEVQVLSSSSCISVDTCAPTGSLSTLYGTAQKLEFVYNPGNTVSLKQIQAGMACASGSNSNQMAFMEISNSSNPFASNAAIYFEGEVVSGEKIFADATLNQLTNTLVAAPNNHFSTVPGADIYAYVFKSQSDFLTHASPVQTMVYNTSGSQAMHLGDQIGSLSLIGYVGAKGGHLVS